MKVLISSCVLGNKVRWNGADKHRPDVQEWAKENGITLVPVCPEHELFGTPRQNIRLIQIGEKVCAKMGKEDVYERMEEKAREIFERHPDARGFIGIANSPSCGVSVGVKNRGSVMRGIMHLQSPVPSCEVNQLKNEGGKEVFLTRLFKNAYKKET